MAAAGAGSLPAVGLVQLHAKRLLISLGMALLAAISALALAATAPASGAGCPSFRVLHDDRIGPASLPAGSYAITAEAGLSCQAASQLFTRFLAAPGGTLPFPWYLKNQTATFYKPAHPLRSAFRVEPLNGT